MPKFSDEQKQKLTQNLLRKERNGEHEWYHLFGVLFAAEAFDDARALGLSRDDFPFDTMKIAKRLDDLKAQMFAQSEQRRALREKDHG